MATNNKQDKINRLKVYADNLRSRLTGGIPEKHKDSPEGFLQMVKIDLAKTEAKIKELQGL